MNVGDKVKRLDYQAPLVRAVMAMYMPKLDQ